MAQAVTTIAPHTMIKGELRMEGPGVLSGQVQGNVTATGELEIGTEGVIEGDIRGPAVTIHGVVKGNIEAANGCRLGATARVAGNICTADLTIGKGARFIGQVCVGETETQVGGAAEACDTRNSVAGPGAMAIEGLRPSGAAEEEEALRAVEATITRVERVATPREEAAPTVMTTMAIPAAPAMPTVQILGENVQATLHRAPRIIKARHSGNPSSV